MNFAKWLNRIIGPKNEFLKVHNWAPRDVYRWCTGKNFPKSDNLAQLLYDLSIYKNREYTNLLCEAHAELMKDYREKEYAKIQSLKGSGSKK